MVQLISVICASGFENLTQYVARAGSDSVKLMHVSKFP